jgi:hypothetical protein
MTIPSNHASYLQTKEKLAGMEARLSALTARTDLDPTHRAEVQRSYEEMIRQYRRDLLLYEASHPELTAPQQT